MFEISNPLRAVTALLAAFAAGVAVPATAQEVDTAPLELVAPEPVPVTIYDAEIVAEYPHDPEAFTQGLLWHDGYLYESTGQEGYSQVRRVDLETGEVLLASDIPPDQFGEGLTLFGDELISLTWQTGQIHRWRVDDLSHVSTAEDYPWQGWGLATLGDRLVASDGSAVLHILDPETYEVEEDIFVTLEGQYLGQINELEVIDGMIFANVWFSNVIVMIEPESGAITGIIDLGDIVDQVEVTDDSAVLNGIAYDAENDRLFVTGKLWPVLYEIRFSERPPEEPAEPAADPAE